VINGCEGGSATKTLPAMGGCQTPKDHETAAARASLRGRRGVRRICALRVLAAGVVKVERGRWHPLLHAILREDSRCSARSVFTIFVRGHFALSKLSVE